MLFADCGIRTKATSGTKLHAAVNRLHILTSRVFAPEAYFSNKLRFTQATNWKFSFDSIAVPRGVKPPTFGFGNRCSISALLRFDREIRGGKSYARLAISHVSYWSVTLNGCSGARHGATDARGAGASRAGGQRSRRVAGALVVLTHCVFACVLQAKLDRLY